MGIGVRTNQPGGGLINDRSPVKSDPECGRCDGTGLIEIEHDGELPREHHDFGDGRLNHSARAEPETSYHTVTRCSCKPPHWGA